MVWRNNHFDRFVLQVGKTKVFLRAGQMAELDAYRSEVLGRSASIIQRKVRSYLCRKKFVLLRLSAIQIQALCRGTKYFHLVLLGDKVPCSRRAGTQDIFFFWLIAGQVGRHRYENMRREAASVKIQKYGRSYISRNAYKNACSSAVSIQTGMRGLAARKELKCRKQTWGAVVIQVRITLAACTYFFLIKFFL